MSIIPIRGRDLTIGSRSSTFAVGIDQLQNPYDNHVILAEIERATDEIRNSNIVASEPKKIKCQIKSRDLHPKKLKHFNPRNKCVRNYCARKK